MVLQCLTMLFKPILALHNHEFFELSKLMGGGGKTIMFAPNIFIGGGGGRLHPCPPPQDRRLCKSEISAFISN